MIIGIDASRANREKKTGVEWYSYHLIENLEKLDTENHYFLYSVQKLSSFVKAPASDGSTADKLEDKKDSLNQPPLNWQNKVLKWPPKFLWTQIRFSLAMLLNSPDLLFVPSHVIPLIHPKKVITTIHDLGFKRFPQAYSLFQRWYLDWSVKFALKRATKIIVPSQFTKKELIEIYQADEKKVKVIPLAHNDKVFYQDNDQNKIDQILKKYNIKKPYFLYVGRLEEKKNISFLIEVFKNLSSEYSFSLVLAGNRGYGYEKIENKINEYNLDDRIIQLNWVSEEDLACLYSGAKVFVFPSLYEGFGIPILEAMACGTPIVASGTASIPEIAGDAILLANPKNVQDFIQQIKNILNNNNLEEELRQKGLERVRNFDWQKCAQETLNLFDELK